MGAAVKMTYEFTCQSWTCQNYKEEILIKLEVEKRDSPQLCEHCGFKLKRVVSKLHRHGSWGNWN